MRIISYRRATFQREGVLSVQSGETIHTARASMPGQSNVFHRNLAMEEQFADMAFRRMQDDINARLWSIALGGNK